MAKTAKTPKTPKSDPAMVDPFAETAATPTPARRKTNPPAPACKVPR